MKRTIPLILSVLLCLGAVACAPPKVVQADKLSIVTTAFPEYDFARAVVGELANVHMLLAPGASAHSYDPTPSDIIRIQNADIFLYTGGENDAWAESLLAAIDTSAITVISLMDHIHALQEEMEEDHEHTEKHHEDEAEHHENAGEDPHIWTSPKNALQLLSVIRDGIAQADSAHAQTYAENAGRYQKELEQIDAELTEIVANAVRKKIVVADRFPFLYLVTDYGLSYEAAFPGCSDQTDAGAKTFVRLVNTVTEEGIPYVYYVELSGRSTAEAVSEQTGAGTLLLHSCHNVTKSDFESGVTYVDLMRQNLINLKKGLNE